MKVKTSKATTKKGGSPIVKEGDVFIFPTSNTPYLVCSANAPEGRVYFIHPLGGRRRNRQSFYNSLGELTTVLAHQDVKLYRHKEITLDLSEVVHTTLRHTKEGVREE